MKKSLKLALLLSGASPLSARPTWITPAANRSYGFGATFAVAPMVAPVPEPETYAMLLAGLGLMGVIARRRKMDGKI